MSRRDIILIGGSAGSIQPLSELLAALPATLPAAVIVAVHRSRSPLGDTLPAVLQNTTALRVVAATDRAVPLPGHVYVAPPGVHARLHHGAFRIGEALPGRPSRVGIDVLFRSVAEAYGERVAAIVLSGALDDGTQGLWDVRRAGGITIVQDPQVAEHASMPARAMREVPLHYCLTVAAMADKLVALSTATHARIAPRPRVLIVEDEGVVAMNLEGRLVDAGYDVVGSVATGEEAVATAAATRPDVVVMDIHLASAMRGTEAGRVLWDRFRIPIVYLTAYCDEQTVLEASATMPASYLVKPVTAPQIHAALRMALDRNAFT